MLIKHLPKSCYTDRDMKSVDGIVTHFISAKNILPDDPFNLDAIIQIFKDDKLSAHYLIDRDGTRIELVPPPKIAWHAGRSRMNGRDRCNNFCLGYELVGGTNSPYTADQIAAIKFYYAQDMQEYGIGLDWIQGHDDVRKAWNREHPEKKDTKKHDPGPL